MSCDLLPLVLVILLIFLQEDLCRGYFLSDWRLFGEGAGYQKRISVTGRVFVSMLGYPQRCERKGVSHTCTLSIACWLIGGDSHSGCGASPWLVACCITQSKNKDGKEVKDKMHNVQMREDEYQLQEKSDVFKKPLKNVKATLTRKKDLVSLQQCGMSADRVISKRIIGGNEAKFGQFPWQAHLKISAYQCGGVLVSRRYVATAAHCIISAKMKDIKIYLGELDTQDTGTVLELAPAELHRIKRKVIHPKFLYRTTQPDRYDLALLEMLTEAGQSYHIVPICLPNASLMRQLVGREAVVAGWGKVMPSMDLKGTNVLRSTTVPILDISECFRWHRLKQIKVELHTEMLCAGYEDGRQDACLGDSGGPLVLIEQGRWTLVGITSAGFGCGESHQPGIYHAVPVTADWIRTIIQT